MATSNNNTEPASTTGPSFLERLTSYSLVQYSYATTVHYYNEAKQKNALVKKGLELAETSVGSVAASPLVLSVGKSWEPVLSKADQFGCNQLDKAEATIFKPAAQLYETANATLSSSVKIVEEKVATSKKLVGERVVQPISSTYQQLLGLPAVFTNKVFDFAEGSLDYYLPEESDSEKDSGLVQAEEASAATQEPTQEANTGAKTQSVWARSSSLSQRAYRRAQRKTARRLRIARLYGESVLTKSPLAVHVVNYARTRDPAIRDTLVQEARTTVTYYTDQVKGLLVERPYVKKAIAFVEPYFAQLSYQSFYAFLFTLLATVSTTINPTKKQNSASSTAAQSSSSSSSTSSTPTEEASTNETFHTEAQDDVDVDEDEETSGPAEPDHSSEEEKEEKHFNVSQEDDDDDEALEQEEGEHVSAY